jgi:hypothetical protein
LIFVFNFANRHSLLSSQTSSLSSHFSSCFFGLPPFPFAVDFFGKNDPYCILLLQAGSTVNRQKWRSKTHQEGGKNPAWNETHTFQINEGDDRIQIQVS